MEMIVAEIEVSVSRLKAFRRVFFPVDLWISLHVAVVAWMISTLIFLVLVDWIRFYLLVHWNGSAALGFAVNKKKLMLHFHISVFIVPVCPELDRLLLHL